MRQLLGDGVHATLAYLGSGHRSVDPEVVEELFKIGPSSVSDQPQAELAFDADVGPHCVICQREALLCGLLESFPIEVIGSVSIGSEVTEIAINQASQPWAPGRWISGVVE